MNDSELYKTILLPHAGTPAGDKALKHAIHLAKSSSGKIIILHVVEDIPRAPISLELHSTQIAAIKKQLKEVTREMKEIMEEEMLKRIQVCNKYKIKSELKVTAGSAAEEILRIVKNQKIDLIVMAKRRKLPGIKSLLTLGSVSRKIAERTSTPILLIDVE